MLARGCLRVSWLLHIFFAARMSCFALQSSFDLTGVHRIGRCDFCHPAAPAAVQTDGAQQRHLHLSNMLASRRQLCQKLSH